MEKLHMSLGRSNPYIGDGLPWSSHMKIGNLICKPLRNWVDDHPHTTGKHWELIDPSTHGCTWNVTMNVLLRIAIIL